MDTKKVLNSILLVRKPSLDRRLTLYFLIFGLVIGYASFLDSVMSASKEFLSSVAYLVQQQGITISGNRPNFLWNSINKKNNDFKDLDTTIKRFSSSIHSVDRIGLYCYNIDTDTWYRVDFDSHGVANAHLSTAPFPGTAADFTTRKILYKNPFYWGLKDTLTTTVNMSQQADRHLSFYKVEILRNSMHTILSRHAGNFILFIIFTLCFSRILGYFFSQKIALPIRTLSAGASSIGNGSFGYRFNVKGSDEIAQLSMSLNSMEERIESYVSEITEKIRIMTTMNKIDKAVLSSLSRKDLVDGIIHIIADFLPDYSMRLVLRNESNCGFDVVSYYSARRHMRLSKLVFVPDDSLDEFIMDNHKNFFQRCWPEDFPDDYSRLLGANVRSVINFPIFVADTYLGSFVISRSEANSLLDEEIKMIRMLTDQIGVALNTVQLHEDRESLFIGILLALSRAIDAKSAWTAGHSERVAAYTSKIGQKLGFSTQQLTSLNIASILHDIGKIGVPEAVLDKKDTLARDEFDLIRLHPEKGALIIGAIPHYDDIKDGILYHHERWNASGYPFGLSGHNIPRNARIIAVADVYDALTYDRPYRRGWDTEKALAYLEENKDVLFEGYIVDVFTEIIRSETGDIIDHAN